MTCQFWRPSHVAIRIEELLDIVRAEQARLSAWRQDEAIYLALSDDERAELRALKILDAHYAAVAEHRIQRKHLGITVYKDAFVEDA